MKLRKLVAFAAVCATLLFISCKKDVPDTDQAHLKVIPSNSTYVVCINGKELVDKGGLAKFKDFSSYQLFKDDLQKNEPKLFKKVESLLSDTRKSGLNLDRIYVFGYTDSLNDRFINALSLRVEDAARFKNTIKELSEAADKGTEYKVEEHEGYYTYRMDYSSIFVWDNDKALLLSISDEHGDFGSFLKIDEANNITTNPDFMEFYKARKDVSAWIPLSNIFRLDELGDMFSYNPFLAQLKDASTELSLEFTNEKVALIGKLWPDSLLEQYFKKNDIIKSDFDASLLNYFPEKSFMAFKASYKVDKYYKMIVDGMSAYADSLNVEGSEDEYGYSYSPYSYDDMEGLLKLLKGNNVMRVVELFKGDFVGSLIDFQEGFIPMPQFAFAANVTMPTAVDTLAKYIPLDMQKQKDGKSYVASLEGVMSLYLAQKGEVIYFTNSSVALDAFLSDGYKKSLKDTEVGKDMLTNSAYWYMNLNLDDYPALITMGAKQAMGDGGFAILSDMLRAYSSAKITYDGKSTVEMSLQLNNKDENSLKTIVKMIDKAASKYMMF